MEKNLRNIRNDFKEKGIFYTSNELSHTIKSYVDFNPENIYDPTCGQGNLLSVFDENVEKYGQEIDGEELKKAENRLKNFKGYIGDTLKDDGFTDMKFDCIVANPPFSIKWDPVEDDVRFKDTPCLPPPSKADYAFILHILYHLAPHGKAICLEFPGILYRGQREGKLRKWLIEQNLIERVVHIPGNSFVDTAISTCIIVFNKNKATTDIVFEDKESGKEYTAGLEEIEANDYILSVSSYIHEEIEEEYVDPSALEIHAREQFLKRLEEELKFDKAVCQIEKISIHPFIVQIKRIADKYDDHKARKEIDGQYSVFDYGSEGVRSL